MPSSSITFAKLPKGLPALEASLEKQLASHTHALSRAIQKQPNGFMPFDQFMQLCLYAPGWGYYTAGSTKFATQTPTGDFTTAPQLSPLFGQALAKQIKQILEQCQSNEQKPIILEFGAGTGALAQSLIKTLSTKIQDLEYWILELSPTLKAQQKERLAPLGVTIRWLTELPERFTGCVVANEVLDAMPIHWLKQTPASKHGSTKIEELGVCYKPSANAPVPFALTSRVASPELRHIAQTRFPANQPYCSEINLQAEAWVHSLGQWLEKGAALLIDYGFPQNEYYHPQREQGTLMCHFRHHAHDQPLIYPGLQDITAHVDFTAMADAALDAQLQVYGYTNQATFLLNCGLAQLLEKQHKKLKPNEKTENMPQWVSMANACQKLLLESEMGELFKVLAVGKALQPPLIGFAVGDRRHRL